jgi:PGF-CTERM protein
VTVPGGGTARVTFVHDIVAPGNYTARVDSETATIRVTDSDQGAAFETATAASSTSTQFPGFGIVVALVAVVLGGFVAATRR